MRYLANVKWIPITAAALAIGSTLAWPELIDDVKYFVLAAGMLLLGIPHGAVDHIITSKLYDLSYTVKDQLKFYLPYLALMLLMGIIWYLYPLLGFAIFLICTIYHFGQSDLIHLNLPHLFKNGLYVSRGLMILGLLIFANPQISFPIMVEIAGIGTPSEFFLSTYSLPVAILAGLQHVLLLLFAGKVSGNTIHEIGSHILESAIIIALFLFAVPIIAFTVYFIFWHSLNHVGELKDFFSKRSKNWTLADFYKDSWLFTFISILGLFALYWLNTAFGSPNQMLALFFILISALTLPHVVVFELIFTKKNDTISV